MAEHSYTSRRELDQYAFHTAVTLLVPLGSILLQAVLPKTFPVLAIFDLPLIVVIFFAVARRNPVAGTVTGTLVGLFQDGLTNHPFGVNGIAKGIVGYAAASIGFAVDVENIINRIALNFIFGHHVSDRSEQKIVNSAPSWEAEAECDLTATELGRDK